MKWNAWAWFIPLSIFLVNVIVDLFYSMKVRRERVREQKKFQELEDRLRKLEQLSGLKENSTQQPDR